MLFLARGVPPPSPRDTGLEGTKRNTREQKGKPGPTSTSRRTPASQHDAADPAAQKGPSGHCDPPSTTKRPLGRDVLRPGTSADPKSASSSGSGPSPSAPSAEDPVDPNALNSTIECVQMTRAETSGVHEGSSARPVPVNHNDGRLGIGTVSLAVP